MYFIEYIIERVTVKLGEILELKSEIFGILMANKSFQIDVLIIC